MGFTAAIRSVGQSISGWFGGGSETQAAPAPAAPAPSIATPAPAATGGLPPEKWDSNTKSTVRNLESSIVGGATPPMDVRYLTGRSTELRSGSYKTNIIPQERVSGVGANGIVRIRVTLPASGHTKDQNANGIADYIEYTDPKHGKVNKSAVWVRYIDEPKDRSTLGSSGYDSSTPISPWGGDAALGQSGKILARDIQTAKRGNSSPPEASGASYDYHLVGVVDVDVPLKKGKVAILMFDPAPGHSAGVGGFGNGRTVQLFWDGT